MTALLVLFFALQEVPPLYIGQEPLEGPTTDPGSVPTPRQEDPFKAIGRILGHPFRDNGRRFDAYPYAGDGPYFLTSRLSPKMYAVMLEMTFGRIDHDMNFVGTEVMVSWSAGCDARIDSLVFEDRDGRGTTETQLSHIHLDIGGYEGPNTLDYSFGFGFGALDTDESSDFGPSIRGALRWFPVRPFSFRFYVVGTWFGDESVADLRGDVGIHVHRFSINLGVRSLLRTEGDDFAGPMLGIAVYF
jgi:hypothetical protein